MRLSQTLALLSASLFAPRFFSPFSLTWIRTYLGVGFVRLDGEVGGRRRSGELGCDGITALLTPVVRINPALESNERNLHCVGGLGEQRQGRDGE